MTTIDLTTRVGRVELANPILTASGTFGYGDVYASLMDLDSLGGIVTKGLSRHPRPGNRGVRVCETPSGMLNAIGLENVGVDHFLREKIPPLEAVKTRVVVNIYGTCPEEYGEVARLLDPVDRVDALEVNISCPNVKAGGIQFATRPEAAAEVTAIVRAATDKPVWVKLSPVTNIVEVAQAVAAAGAEALTVINTLPAMAIDLERRRPVLGNGTGGLSGPAIKPVALKMVWDVARAVDIPIVGGGGIMNARDAAEFLVAGATAVEVGTASFVDPRAAQRIAEDLPALCARLGVERVADLVGTLQA